MPYRLHLCTERPRLLQAGDDSYNLERGTSVVSSEWRLAGDDQQCGRERLSVRHVSIGSVLDRLQRLECVGHVGVAAGKLRYVHQLELGTTHERCECRLRVDECS